MALNIWRRLSTDNTKIDYYLQHCILNGQLVNNNVFPNVLLTFHAGFCVIISEIFDSKNIAKHRENTYTRK